MRKLAMVVAGAATLGAMAVAGPAPAEAQVVFGPAVVDAPIAGTVIAGPYGPRYGYGPGYGYYDEPTVVYARPYPVVRTYVYGPRWHRHWQPYW
jgi:hypothetical protein